MPLPQKSERGRGALQARYEKLAIQFCNKKSLIAFMQSGLAILEEYNS